MANIKLWSKRLALGLVVLIGVCSASLLVYQRFSDGPTGPLTGGTFSSGEIITTPVQDWQQLAGDFEFELVGQGSSRTAGGILLDDNLYISCDLGFVWSRLPAGLARNTLHAIWLFKDWHEKALQDGRIRIRKDGRIHAATIERVEDPILLEELKTTIEGLAGEFFTGGLGPRPTNPPDDIWFFRVRQP